MNTEVKSAFQKIEANRLSLLDKMSKFSDEKLNKKPAPESWSAIQTAYHLLSAETSTLGYLEKKVQSKDSIPMSGFKSIYRSTLLKLFLFLPFKFKAPKMVENVPDFKPFKELKQEWDAKRQALAVLLETLTDKDIKRELFKHPLAGKMNILQMLEFINDHLLRHVKQIDKCLGN